MSKRPRGVCVRGVVVTDHALVRFLERCKSLDVKAIAREIVTNEHAARIKRHPYSDIDCPALGVIIVVRQGRVISVVPRGKKGAA